MPASTRVSRETTTCDRADRIVRAHRPVSTTTNCRHKQSAAGAAALLDCVPLAPHFSVLPFTTPTPAQPESTADFCHSGCKLSPWIQACCGHSLRSSGAPEEGFPRVSVISLRCLGVWCGPASVQDDVQRTQTARRRKARERWRQLQPSLQTVRNGRIMLCTGSAPFARGDGSVAQETKGSVLQRASDTQESSRAVSRMRGACPFHVKHQRGGLPTPVRHNFQTGESSRRVTRSTCHRPCVLPHFARPHPHSLDRRQASIPGKHSAM